MPSRRLGDDELHRDSLHREADGTRGARSTTETIEGNAANRSSASGDEDDDGEAVRDVRPPPWIAGRDSVQRLGERLGELARAV